MKVLATGGAGFIGSNVVDALITKGYNVAVVDDLSTGREKNLNPKASFHKIDIRDKKMSDVFAEEKPDVVVHHAAQINVRESVKNPAFDADINVCGSLNVLECAKKNKVKKFVYASSGGAVYGEPDYLPADENHPIRPICPYGASKYAFELYLAMYEKLYGLDYNILRYGNVYGPRQDPLGEAGVVAIFTGLLLSRKTPTIFGDGEQTRDFVYVGDVAAANLLAVEKKTKSKIFNIGFGKPTSVNEITKKLIEATGAKIKPVYGDPVPGEVRHIHLNISRAKKELGWTPKVGLTPGIEKTVEWSKEK